MLDKRRFQEQMQLLSTYFMRELGVGLLDIYWTHFKDKEQEPWDRAVDEAFREGKKFPVIAALQNYYGMSTSPKEDTDFPRMKALEKAAKTRKHKYYLKLIYDLLNGKIKIDDPRVQKCLDEQGEERVFERFDPERRCFKKYYR